MNNQAEVFFDSRCRICKLFKSFIQNLDVQKSMKFKDLWQERSGRISARRLSKEIHLVTPEGELYKGYYAIKYTLLKLIVFAPLRIFINSLLMDKLGVLLYEFVSRNRMKLNFCRGNCNY